MSKIGKKNIIIPKESSIKIEGANLTITGPKGTKKLTINDTPRCGGMTTRRNDHNHNDPNGHNDHIDECDAFLTLPAGAQSGPPGGLAGKTWKHSREATRRMVLGDGSDRSSLLCSDVLRRTTLLATHVD